MHVDAQRTRNSSKSVLPIAGRDRSSAETMICSFFKNVTVRRARRARRARNARKIRRRRKVRGSNPDAAPSAIANWIQSMKLSRTITRSDSNIRILVACANTYQTNSSPQRKSHDAEHIASETIHKYKFPGKLYRERTNNILPPLRHDLIVFVRHTCERLHFARRRSCYTRSVHQDNTQHSVVEPCRCTQIVRGHSCGGPRSHFLFLLYFHLKVP